MVCRFLLGASAAEAAGESLANAVPCRVPNGDRATGGRVVSEAGSEDY
jgi:hypothetical protein